MKSMLFALVGLLACGTSPGGDDGPGEELPGFTNGVSTLSGAGQPGYVDGPRGEARFSNPVNTVVGPNGMVYVADFDNNRVRVVDPDDGNASTLVEQEGFKKPFAMVVANGKLYVSTDDDPQGGHSLMSGTIWSVDLATGVASPLAVKIGRPRGLAMLNGKLVASDYDHHVIQWVDPGTGAVTPFVGAWDVRGTLDGAGGAARFATPYGIAAANGKLYVADYDNHSIREVSPEGDVVTMAGTNVAGFIDGSIATAQFHQPQGITATTSGDLYITDAGNFRVRAIRNGMVSTVVGSGVAGYQDSDDPTVAQLFGLEGLGVTSDGTRLFIADGSRGENVPFNRIRRVELD